MRLVQALVRPLKIAAVILFPLFASLTNAAHAAPYAVRVALGSDGYVKADRRIVSATPFDPNSISQGHFVGGTKYSTRRVAVELILNAVRLRNHDSLIYRRTYHKGYRITRHWRLRASTRRFSVAYEIRF